MLDSVKPGTSEDTGSIVESERFTEDDIRPPDHEESKNRGVQREAGPVKSEEDVELDNCWISLRSFSG